MSGQEMRWNLDDIYPAGNHDVQYSALESALEQVPDILGELDPCMSRESFRNVLSSVCRLREEASILEYRPYLEFAVNAGDSHAKRDLSRTDALGTKMSEALLPFWLWIQGKPGRIEMLDDANAERLFASVPEFSHTLHRKRSLARHTLSELEERLISNKDLHGVSKLVMLRRELTSDFKYWFKPEGVKRGRTISEESRIRSFFQSANPTEREAAYESHLRRHEENAAPLFTIYSGVVGDWESESRLRGYPKPISMRNVRNAIQDEIVETLLSCCRDRRGIFQEYFRFKARELGMDELRRYDIYAPLEYGTQKIPLENATRMVLDSMREFSPAFAERAERIIREGHIDSHPRRKKRGGAFCATPSTTTSPYVLLNYEGTPEDTMTLAHELGHGVHSLYSDHLMFGVHSAPLTLAETASTFAEMLLFDRLYDAADAQTKKSMLSKKIYRAYATIIRQNYFVMFEKEAHAMIPAGTTAEDLSETYMGQLKEQFGDSISLPDSFRNEWLTIPHIVESPFYCYSYCFGELLTTALYKKYKEGSLRAANVERILSAGGSADAMQLLKEEAGVDITERSFWDAGFDVYEGMVEELGRF